MLSDEEKEVVNMIKTGLEVSVEGQIIEQIHISRKEAKALLNLIEKQSKEIEELKNADFATVYLNGIYDGKKKVEDKIKAILEKYKYTEIGDSEKIIEFYKKMQSLLEKE